MERTLSTGLTREENIARLARMRFADAPIPPKPVVAPKPGEPDATDDTSTEPSEADKTVASMLGDLLTQAEAIQAAQAKDPDVTTDPNDAKVTAALQAITTAIKDASAAQETDSAAAKPDDTKPEGDAATGAPADAKTAPAPGDVKLALDNTTPVSDPVDDKGNVDPETICVTPTENGTCGHLAVAHANTEDGDNTGACSMQNCGCDGMTYDAGVPGTPTDPEGDDSDGSGDGGPDNAGGTDLAAAALADVAVAPMPVGGANVDLEGGELPPMADAESNPAPEMEGSMNIGPAFTIPVMIIEGQDTGDGRALAVDSLDWGPMPMALMGNNTATHDPMGFDMNDPSVLCGRIESIERVSGENDTQLIKATGHFLSNDDGLFFADLLEQMGRLPISADVIMEDSVQTGVGIDEFGFPIFTDTLTKGTIGGCTILPMMPAFAGAYIVMGDGSVIPDAPAMNAADQVPDGGDAVVASVHVRWIGKDGNCEPCQRGILTASGVAPAAPPKAWFEKLTFEADDALLREIFVGRGDRREGGAFAVPFTITDEGEVFGHIAPWGVCHVGIEGTCVTPPHSEADYAHFKREGQKVKTMEGDLVSVGTLTFHAGHAKTGRGITPTAAMAHYDNTATAWAHVNIWEDAYGIAVHGAVLPDITDNQLREIRAASPSGDWREIGGNLELVATLMVNEPGFPVAVVADGAHATALVAAGAMEMFSISDQAMSITADGTTKLADTFSVIAERVILRERATMRAEMYALRKTAARETIASLRRP